MPRTFPALAAALIVAAIVAPARAQDAPAEAKAARPNIVWIVSEDNSKHYLKLFDEHGATTPNIEKLAAHGLAFNHAFSCAPVCSVARTTLATGCYAPRIGAHHHRRLAPAVLPESYQMYSTHLMRAGYYATNNAKTDFNVKTTEPAFHDSSRKAHWRNRKDKSQPFFHMESHAVSHESSLHFDRKTFETQKTQTDPASVTIWPYFPDTPLLRYTTARYHDRMKAVDEIVGRVVKQLEEDGELENTFVFYFGDHGGVLPGSKGYAWERGLHVPLVVRIPANFRHLVHPSMPNGSRVDGFVEFVDFGPTALRLAGVDVPDSMDGEPFLGPELALEAVNGRDEAFGYADRFDEKYDMVRTLRKGKYKYVRSYHPYYPDGLQNNYRYRMLAYEQWRKMYEAGELNAEQAQFFRPRAAEALYDLEADPHELRNLAGDPEHAQRLGEMRTLLRERLVAMPDLGFYPEPVLVKQVVANPVEYGRTHRREIGAMIEVADLALRPFEQAQPMLAEALAQEDAALRYWALVVCSTFGEAARPLVPAAKRLLDDAEPLVRVRAAEFLAIVDAADPRPTIMNVLATSDDHVTALLTLNTVVYLRDVRGIDFDVSKADVKATGGEVMRRVEYLSP